MEVLSAVPSDLDHGNVAAAVSAEARTLFCETPLLYSAPLSQRASRSNGAGVDVDVYIKLDCLQPSGSFKDRGMAHLLTTLRRQHGCRRIVSSSGGNAGLAAATVARQLLGGSNDDGNDDNDNIMHCTVVVPATTKPHVINKLRDDLAATVIVHGNVWNEADAYARQLVANDAVSGRTAYVPPYEHELLWTGHSTVVDEIYRQLGDTTTTRKNTTTPDAIIVSVGGGGLLCGVLEGLQRRRHDDDEDDSTCHVIAAETVGASSFAQAYRRGELVTLPNIDSVATSLGALQVSPSALTRTREYGTDNVSPAVCTDAQAIDACWQFAQDHRLLVEPACGAALAVIYSQLFDFSSLQQKKSNNKVTVVVEICGGSGVSLDLLQGWRNEYCGGVDDQS